jgi:hypothetical protein
MKKLLLTLLFTVTSTLLFSQLRLEGSYKLDRMMCMHTNGEIVMMEDALTYIETDSTITFLIADVVDKGDIVSVKEVEDGVYKYVITKIHPQYGRVELEFLRVRKEYIMFIVNGDKQLIFFKKQPPVKKT